MRKIMLYGSCFFLFLPSALYAVPRGQSPPVKPRPAADALAGQRSDLAPRSSPANRWRYTFHDGHWWYYRDGGRWSYWTGADWRDYEPKSYRRWYVRQKMAQFDAKLARFDNGAMRAYLSPSLTENLSGGYSGGAAYNYRGPVAASSPASALPITAPWARGGWSASRALGAGLFTPRAFDGRLNPATSTGGYMGGALRGPFGD